MSAPAPPQDRPGGQGDRAGTPGRPRPAESPRPRAARARRRPARPNGTPSGSAGAPPRRRACRLSVRPDPVARTAARTADGARGWTGRIDSMPRDVTGIPRVALVPDFLLDVR